MMTIHRINIPQKIPLRIALIIPFILVVTFTVGLASYIAFFNGQKAVDDIAYQLRKEVSARIADHLHGFLETPHQINQFNIISIQQGWLDTKNSRDMQDYFLEQVKTHDTITSIYFGNIDGGIIGSGREGAGGALYVYDTENLKIGTFNKYAITDTGDIGKLLTSVPNFDTRIRPWYIGAIQNGTATWSDIYILFTGQDMAISASSPVYDEWHHLLGVVSVDIFLSQIENFLSTLDISKSGQSFIMEHSGLLVAASTGERSFRENNGKMERLDARNSRTPIVKYAAEFLHERLGENYDVAHDEQFDFEINGERYFLNVSPVHDQYGIDWLIVVVIPESDFMSEITATNQMTLFIIILALALSILSSIFIAQKITDRISYLNKFTHTFTNGGGDGLVLSESHISEIDELTLSFIEVKRQLHQTLDDLHAEVGIRKLIEQALRESETLFRAIFEQAAAGIFTLSLDGKFLSVNQHFCDITGYTREELLNLFFKDIIHPDDLSADLVNKQTLLSNDASTYSAEKRYFRKDGSTIWVNLTVSLLSDTAKAPVYFLGIVEDITERKQVEKRLVSERNLLSTLLDNLPDRVYVKDIQGRKIISNVADWHGSGGKTMEDVLGKSDFDTYPPELAAKFWADDKSVLDSGISIISREEPGLDSLGNPICVLTTKVPLRDGTGQITGLVGIGRDITERKQFEEALNESKLLFHLLIESLPQNIYAKDIDGRFVFANQHYCATQGRSLEEIVGKTDFEIHPPELAEKYRLDDRRVIETGKTIELEEEHQPIGKKKFFVQVIKTPFYDSKGQTAGTLGIFWDVTERKYAEEELHRSKKALESANLALQTALAREKQLSHTDALTGINNRRHLFELAEREFDIATRYQHSLSVMMFDIDHFKEVNDIFGHAVGDQILQRVIQIACAELRSADVIGRYGGEEFVIMLPMTDAQQAHPVAERIRAGVAAMRLPTSKGDVAVTVSIGISETILRPRDESVEDVIRRADEAMYASKRAGRNRTVIFDSK